MIAGVLRKIIVVMIGGNLKTSTIVMTIGGNLKTSTIVMMIGGNLKTNTIVMTIGSSIEISVVVNVSLFVAIVTRNIGKIFSANLKAKNLSFGLINTRL
ncbi:MULTISPECIES: hypothetical protein [Bacillus cereus group]|uniref:hypothetical protein n=1 Tax=Bacillus cereus group TaxID=86661 RepID=UPI0007F97CBB|nr:hypothetical protein [Bacillus cereus]ARV92738.1 hypothetical protein BJG91_08960 [Bacillus thuringiensis]OKP55770.1 hypothetical protein A8A07_19245 [Bacillus cereus]